MRSLEGKVALITGAGSPIGIGFACARALSREGAKIALTATGEQKAQARAGALRDQMGGKVLGLVADVSDEVCVQETVAAVVRAFGRLDILVNNAVAVDAAQDDGPIGELAVQVWDRSFTVNVRGAMLACKYALPHLLASGSGCIINISSQEAETGCRKTAYSCSKAALNALTLNVAFAYGKQGLRANAVAPGVIVTRESMPETWHKGWLEHALTPRLGKPEDIGEMVAFLCRNEASYITGQVISVDGGLMSHGTWTGTMQLPAPRRTDAES